MDDPWTDASRNFGAGLQRRDQHVDRRGQEKNGEDQQEKVRPEQRAAAVARHAAIVEQPRRRWQGVGFSDVRPRFHVC